MLRLWLSRCTLGRVTLVFSVAACNNVCHTAVRYGMPVRVGGLVLLLLLPLVLALLVVPLALLGEVTGALLAADANANWSPSRFPGSKQHRGLRQGQDGTRTRTLGAAPRTRLVAIEQGWQPHAALTAMAGCQVGCLSPHRHCHPRHPPWNSHHVHHRYHHHRHHRQPAFPHYPVPRRHRTMALGRQQLQRRLGDGR